MRVAVVQGQFVEQAEGSVEYLNGLAAQTLSLSLPLDFTLVVTYDTETLAEVVSEYETEYESKNGSMDLYLGNGMICISQPESQVQIWHTNALRAVGFGSNEAFEWGGLAIRNYGVYAFFWDAGTEIPYPSDDGLHWLWDLQENEQLRQQAYVTFRGFHGSHMIYFRTRGRLGYSVYTF